MRDGARTMSMRGLLGPMLLFLLVWLQGMPAGAYPVIGTAPETVVIPRTSQYRQGYTDAAGRLYTGIERRRPDNSWGPVAELRQNLGDLLPLLAGGQARLVDYFEPRLHAVYTGNGLDLQASNTNYGWKGQYGIRFTGQAVKVEVGVQLLWSGITDPVDQLLQQLIWEQRIEGWWDGRYTIVKDERLFFPIDFELEFGGREDGHGGRVFDHRVVATAGSGLDDAGQWFVDSDAQDNAHEFGHLLGLYDEYWTGGLKATGLDASDPAIVPIDTTHLMGATQRFAFGGGMKAAYFEEFMSWLDGVDPDATQTYRLGVPEPGSAALVGLALGVLAAASARRRRAGAAAAGPVSGSCPAAAPAAS